jgi:hypothetical protein
MFDPPVDSSSGNRPSPVPRQTSSARALIAAGRDVRLVLLLSVPAVSVRRFLLWGLHDLISKGDDPELNG